MGSWTDLHIENDFSAVMVKDGLLFQIAKESSYRFIFECDVSVMIKVRLRAQNLSLPHLTTALTHQAQSFHYFLRLY